MCGICGSVSFNNSKDESEPIHFKSSSFEKLKNHLQRRGPNNFKHLSLQHKEKIDLFFCASVLHLRGSSLTEQPIADTNGNLLLWNGEIFSGSLVKTGTESDSTILAKELFSGNDTSDILKVISNIEGPYAFIFYQAAGLLWFGRDIFGRRSLLWNFEDSTFQICSVACGKTRWEEIPAVGIFCLDLNETMAENKFVIHEYAWSSSATGNSLRREAEFFSGIDRTEVLHMLDFSVKIPIGNALNRNLPSDETSLKFLNQLDELQSCKVSEQDLFKRLLNITVLSNTVNEFEQFLSCAVKKRVENELGLCKLCYLSKISNDAGVTCDHASVGVLFSGGLDSIVIACLVDRHLVADKPIDLINVAFSSAVNEEGRRKQVHSEPFNTPDRITGKNGLKELEKISPSRKWNFVEVNVSKDELIAKRHEFISHLLHPLCTVLDDSIGCALWFASQGKGSISACVEYHDYNSPVRVLLVGMGADEQLAGYSRHRVKFNDSGWSGLIQELSLELDRIGSRNLGRDDRIIADSGVESRYPFLDESVVSFLNGLPVWLKANLNFPRGIGEKLLLRLLAFKLGLINAAGLPKRAIQFGSRIAKIESTKEKGFDVCERLTSLNC